jgi:hypothetical protein
MWSGPVEGFMVKPPHLVPADGANRRKTALDRRTEDDRRRVYSLQYFSRGGEERRFRSDRRTQAERRKGWAQTGPWSSDTEIPDGDDSA